MVAFPVEKFYRSYYGELCISHSDAMVENQFLAFQPQIPQYLQEDDLSPYQNNIQFDEDEYYNDDQTNDNRPYLLRENYDEERFTSQELIEMRIDQILRRPDREQAIRQFFEETRKERQRMDRRNTTQDSRASMSVQVLCNKRNFYKHVLEFATMCMVFLQILLTFGIQMIKDPFDTKKLITMYSRTDIVFPVFFMFPLIVLIQEIIGRIVEELIKNGRLKLKETNQPQIQHKSEQDKVKEEQKDFQEQQQFSSHVDSGSDSDSNSNGDRESNSDNESESDRGNESESNSDNNNDNDSHSDNDSASYSDSDSEIDSEEEIINERIKDILYDQDQEQYKKYLAKGKANKVYWDDYKRGYTIFSESQFMYKYVWAEPVMRLFYDNQGWLSHIQRIPRKGKYYKFLFGAVQVGIMYLTFTLFMQFLFLFFDLAVLIKPAARSG